jgi:DNA mismatch repair protein MutS2
VQAEELLREANRRIENTIREIREAEAEKAVTRRLREEMAEFRDEVSDIDASAKDAAIEKKMQQILARREREAKRKEERQQKKQQPVMLQNAETATDAKRVSGDEVIETVCEGNYVKIKGTKSGGYIESVQGKYAVVVIGDMRTKMPLKKLERAEEYKEDNRTTMLRVPESSRMTRNVIDEHRNGFSQEIDVRGMRGDEALLSVQRFVDDAILIGVSRVRILHGKGNGILRMLVRQYLEALPNVISCKDEHVQFGGAGITVVELG